MKLEPNISIHRKETRKETMITTAMVFLMVVVASVFFLVVDQVIGWGVRMILGAGG